ncbi:hypothetical protein LTR42_009627 [Elasticomyces elasticus]|nr:hypothetical protein LTR42_009627 [Elasticomyces elasticus]
MSELEVCFAGLSSERWRSGNDGGSSEHDFMIKIENLTINHPRLKPHFFSWYSYSNLQQAETFGSGDTHVGFDELLDSTSILIKQASDYQKRKSQLQTALNRAQVRPTFSSLSLRPNEANAVTLPPVNVGVTADTVRAELVILATAINAGVPVGSDKYQVNSNNTVTVDYVQTDVIALPRSQVREIHTVDPTTCQISNILGYVHGALTVVTAGLNLTEVLDDLKAGESVGQVLGGLGL